MWFLLSSTTTEQFFVTTKIHQPADRQCAKQRDTNIDTALDTIAALFSHGNAFLVV